MYYFGVCAIIKDEEPFLDEWMAYYTLLGAEAFYLYDNGSATPLRQTLRKYERFHTPESLRIHDAPGEKLQMITYGHCLAAYANKCRWIAFVDLDEFIVPKRHDTIPAMLEEFEPYAGLALSWRTFGSNGHVTRPQGLQIENYTRALAASHSLNRHIKTIVNPTLADHFSNPHICALKNPADRIVLENHELTNSAWTDVPSWEKGQINHYYFRSKKDFFTKLRRPRADNGAMRTMAEKGVVLVGEEEDTSAVRFAPGVKEIIHRTDGV